MFGRSKVATLLAEFFGTAILTLVVLGVQRSTIGIPYFVALAAGLTVTVMLFALGRVSGAQLNPALTIGLWTARKIGTIRAAVYIVAQLLGAWAAYGIFTYVSNQNMTVLTNHVDTRVFVAEIVGAFIFTIGWAAATYRAMDGGLFASTAGIAFALGMIVAAIAGIGLINPALALGTRAWEIWSSVGWFNYILGPILGAFVGVNLYQWFFAPEAAGRAAAAVATTSRTAAAKPAAKKRSTTARKKSK